MKFNREIMKKKVQLEGGKMSAERSAPDRPTHKTLRLGSFDGNLSEGDTQHPANRLSFAARKKKRKERRCFTGEFIMFRVLELFFTSLMCCGACHRA